MTRKSLLTIFIEPLLIACALALAVRAAAGIYTVPSNSMAPALMAGDRILVTRFITDTPARGDVVVFRDPIDRELTVKRVVALPGELVEAQLVPADHLFVMGDNRGDSWDSRHWGPLPRSRVVGRARMVLWHRGQAQRIFKWVE